jgi:cell division protein FtsB
MKVEEIAESEMIKVQGEFIEQLNQANKELVSKVTKLVEQVDKLEGRCDCLQFLNPKEFASDAYLEGYAEQYAIGEAMSEKCEIDEEFNYVN